MVTRTENMSFEENSLLIAFWSEETMQNELGGTHITKKVFEVIAQQLRDAGYQRTAEQYQFRLKNIKTVLYQM